MTTPPASFKSTILPDFPELLNDLSNRFFVCLYRGSRDGFRAADFHRCCDDHPHTLTLIQDTSGNVFGGYSNLPWKYETRRVTYSDYLHLGYIFTLTNPHDYPPTKFQTDDRRHVVQLDQSTGPNFVEITVADNGNSNWRSATGGFGRQYKNDTGIPDAAFFTGSPNFKVKEVEVFRLLPLPEQSGVAVEYPLPEEGSMRGILSAFYERNYSNPCDEDLLIVSSKSCMPGEGFNRLKDIADVKWPTKFELQNEPDQWIRWDFGPRHIRCTHYTLSAIAPITWVFEGSLDGDQWVELDRQTGIQTFAKEDHDENATQTFAIANPVESRCFRLMVTERVENGRGLIMRPLEFFGTLIT